MPPKKTISKRKTEDVFCPMCGDLKASGNYYKNTSLLYNGSKGIMVFCKDCIVETYEKYFQITKDIKTSVYITCMKFDIPYGESEIEGALKQLIKSPNSNPFRIYMTKLNSLGSFNDTNLCGFEPVGMLEKTNSSMKILSNDGINEIGTDIELTPQDLEVKEDVIRLIGYNPFDGYSKFDQKFLYNELLTYLDEDTLDDNFKLSQIIQLVNNNNQIRKIDLVISSMTADTKSLTANQGEVKSLSQTKQAIVNNTDKIAKENSISVKNRGDKSAGKSTLTYMMKQYRELGFEKAEQDYYDQNKAYGMKVTADISNKSLLEQLQLDENDYTEMINNQRELVQELQSKIEDVEEENRQLHVIIDGLKKNKE